MRSRHIDFTKTGTKEPLLGWALLCLGIAVVAACAIHYTRLQTKREADHVQSELIRQRATDATQSLFAG